MKSTDLKYIIAIGTSKEKRLGVADLMKIIKVSDVAVYKELKKLEEQDLIYKECARFLLTEKGNKEYLEYTFIINFLSKHLKAHCNIDDNTAYNDGINVACALSDEGRMGLVKFLKENCSK